jgi:hypothetical protein
MGSYWMSLDRCFCGKTRSLSLSDDRGGVRLFGPKCCGRWTEEHKWPCDADLLREAVTEMECAIEALEAGGEKES